MGRTIFSYTRYEKVKRVTRLLHSATGELQIFMVSFDVYVDPEPMSWTRLRKKRGSSIEEMNGEIYALEYVLEETDDLF